MAVSKAAQRRTVAVFSADAALRVRLAERVRSLGRYSVTEAPPDVALAGKQAKDEADIVVFDVGNGTLLDDPRLWAMTERLAGRQLLIVSEPLPAERVRSVIRLKAADWLQSPFGDDEFVASLVRVEGTLAGAASRVMTFIGASGGAGATTLALAGAYHLANKHGTGAVGVVDLDFQSASCSAFLNLGKNFDLDPLLASPERLDTELLDLIKLERKPNIAVYSFERADLFFSPNAANFVLRLLDQVALKHRDVVIDLPNLSTPWFDDVVRNSDKVFVVLESNVPSLRQGRRLLERVRALRDASRIVPVINKTTLRLFGNAIGRSDIGKMLGEAKFHTVSRDDELATDALNRALVLAEVSSGAKLTKEANALFASTLG